MLGMFLNSADADRVSHDLNMEAIAAVNRSTQTYERMIDMRLKAHQQWENKLDAAYRQIAAMQEALNVLQAESNAKSKVINELVDISNPEHVYAIRKIRSRKLDEELDTLLAEGHIKNDPRADAEWVGLMRYTPS